jgi:hypothetical protein
MDLHIFKPKLEAQSILAALNSYIDSASTVSSNPPVFSTSHALDLRPVSPILPDVMANTHGPTTQKGPPETVHRPPPPEEHSPMQEPDSDEEQEDPQLTDEVLKIGDGDL